MRSPVDGQPATPFSLLAEALPIDAAVRILEDHEPDATGHCRGCRLPTTAAPVWPCRLWSVADEVRRSRRSAR